MPKDKLIQDARIQIIRNWKKPGQYITLYLKNGLPCSYYKKQDGSMKDTYNKC